MYLYNLTLQRATGIIQAVQGNFSGTKQQEIVIARGKVLEIVKPDPNTGKVHTLLSQEVFGIIRSIISFRLTGGNKGEFSEYILYNKYILLTYINSVFRLPCGWIRLWANCHS
jgi:splicing factor 3B subunit 3